MPCSSGRQRDFYRGLKHASYAYIKLWIVIFIINLYILHNWGLFTCWLVGCAVYVPNQISKHVVMILLSSLCSVFLLSLTLHVCL